MTIGIILIIGGAILFTIPMGWTTFFGVIILLFGIFLTIKGKKSRTKSKMNYTAEARRACEEITPKRKRDEKPPWEE